MRHLNTKFCGSNMFCGRIDCDITPEAEVFLTAKMRRQIESKDLVVFSSPMKRCIDTVDKLKLIFSIDSVTFCDALIERDYGIYNGTKKQDVQALINTRQEVDFRNDIWLRPTNGESQMDVQIRVHNCMEALKGQYKQIFIITHQGVLREIYSWIGISDFKKFYPGEIRMEVI